MCSPMPIRAPVCGLDVGRAGEVVGVGVGLERPVDADARFARCLQDRFDGARVDLAGVLIVVEHGVDDGAALRFAVPDQVADRVGRLVEESADF